MRLMLLVRLFALKVHILRLGNSNMVNGCPEVVVLGEARVSVSWACSSEGRYSASHGDYSVMSMLELSFLPLALCLWSVLPSLCAGSLSPSVGLESDCVLPSSLVLVPGSGMVTGPLGFGLSEP